MKALIVGGGIGGLTLGAFLEQSNIEYEIIEKCKDWNHSGFLISLWDSGRDILQKLGLAEQFDTFATRAHTYSIRDGKGRVLKNFDFSHFYADYGTAITIVRRGDLHNWLRSKIPAAKIRMGRSVEKIVQSKDNVSVTFTNGESRGYDIVVGADGVHSAVRDLLFKQHIDSYENWRVWYTWISHAFDVPATVAEYCEPGEDVCVFSAGNSTTAWFFAPADHTVWDSVDGRISRLKEIFKDETYLVPATLDRIRNEDIMPTDLVRFNLKHWFENRAVLLGDAAHNFGPYAGLGSTMAMEDAYVLAGELMQVSETYPLAIVFRNYESRRKKRVHLADGISHRLRMGMLVKSRILRKMVDYFMPFAPERYLLKELYKLLKEEI